MFCQVALSTKCLRNKAPLCLRLSTIEQQESENSFCPEEELPVNPLYLSNPKPGHTMGWLDRGSDPQGGVVWRRWVGQEAILSIWPGANPSFCSPASRKYVF